LCAYCQHLKNERLWSELRRETLSVLNEREGKNIMFPIAVQVKRIVLRIGLIWLGFLIDINGFQNQVHHGDTAGTEGYF